MVLDVCFTIITDCTSLVVQTVVIKSVQGRKNMVQTQNTLIRVCTLFSGVATLGHAGAHAVALLIANRALNGLESNGSVSLCITPNYESHTLIIRATLPQVTYTSLRYNSWP